MASSFEALTRAEGVARKSQENQVFQTLFTKDAVFTDKTFGDLAVGLDAIEALRGNVAV